jgi:hypothetical protein
MQEQANLHRLRLQLKKTHPVQDFQDVVAQRFE